MEKKYSYEELLEIIHTLRSEQGCPWDREQTHKSLRPCVMEEAAELVAAIRIFDQTGNSENLQEELGDILLQVVMHSEIAKEEKQFTMEDVVHQVAQKMVRRHPHVFGTVEVAGASEVLTNWEEIKKKEKEGKSWIESPLREIPIELPSLTRATKVLKKVDKLYEKGNSYEENIKRMESVLSNLRNQEQTSEEELQNSLAEILLAVTDISRLRHLSPEQLLSDKIEDIIQRYEQNLKNL